MSYFPPYIDGSGIHMPTYEDRLQDLCAAYRSIFGQEAELTPAVPDYQLLSVLAKALDDTSALVLAAYNSRNPMYASGQALDLLLPQYGLVRETGETDAEARARIRLALPSGGMFSMDAMKAELFKVPNVKNVLIRVNDTDTTVDGISPHSIMALVDGGNGKAIGSAIYRKKPPGIGTCGSLTPPVTDENGQPVTIRFSRPETKFLTFRIAVTSYDGFDEDAVRTAMRDALMDAVNNGLHIGDALNVPQLYGVLYQAAGNLASTFAITDLSCSGEHGVTREKLIPAWNEIYTIYAATDVTLVVSC